MMTHAYDEFYLSSIEAKLGSMFELAVYEEKMAPADFAAKFISSSFCYGFETGDPVITQGKSANEICASILCKEPKESAQWQGATPEYWLGYVLAYVQWKSGRTYKEIIKAYPVDELLLDYFPYHEMDVSSIANRIESRLPNPLSLKALRLKRGLTQEELAVLSNVPLRTIRAYEQGKLDIKKAQYGTIIRLVNALYCKPDDLL
jgi:DNA-binding XRE family transcriptional regulator